MRQGMQQMTQGQTLSQQRMQTPIPKVRAALEQALVDAKIRP